MRVLNQALAWLVSVYLKNEQMIWVAKRFLGWGNYPQDNIKVVESSHTREPTLVECGHHRPMHTHFFLNVNQYLCFIFQCIVKYLVQSIYVDDRTHQNKQPLSMTAMPIFNNAEKAIIQKIFCLTLKKENYYLNMKIKWNSQIPVHCVSFGEWD